MSKTVDLSIVIPLYNEEEVFPLLKKRLVEILDSFDVLCEVVLVNDGSSDDTPRLMSDLCKEDGRFVSVFLSRNFGHQTAITAGLSYSNAKEAVMVMDGDLQDPPELLIDFYQKLKEGYDVVYAVRKNRKEGWLKKLTYKIYYRLLKNLSSYKIPLDSGDFGMMSKRVVDVILNMPEESRFIRGMRAWVGFSQTFIEYSRDAREAGEPKYSFKMLLQLAFNGIFNFSELPVRAITKLGLVSISVSLTYLIYNLVKKFYFGSVPEGYTSLLFSIVLFSGVQLISIGILGEYILRIFFQVKNRPTFIVDKVISNKVEKVVD